MPERIDINVTVSMKKINVKIISVNNILSDIRLCRLLKWESSIFRIDPIIDEYDLNENHDIIDVDYTAYSVSSLDKHLPNKPYDGLVFFITYEPLERGQFSFVLGKNRIVLSIYEIKDILAKREIPVENHIISMLYSYSLIYLTKKEEFISLNAEQKFAHDPFKKCIFDYRNETRNVMYTSVKPVLCDFCVQKLMDNGISKEVIQAVRSDLEHLKKDTYHTMVEFLKVHPILSIVISVCSSVLINLFCNLIS